jgi:holin-like protein
MLRNSETFSITYAEVPKMPTGFFFLIAFELLGELLHAAFHVPLPGPVIGMFLLAAVLILAEKSARPAIVAAREPLERLSRPLLSWMGLFFVPAGAGLVAEADLLKHEWVPILAGVVGSTILSILATGLAMHFFLQHRHAAPRPGHVRP